MNTSNIRLIRGVVQVSPVALHQRRQQSGVPRKPHHPMEPSVGREVGRKLEIAYARLEEEQKARRERERVLEQRMGAVLQGEGGGEVHEDGALPTLTARMAKGEEHFCSLSDAFSEDEVQACRTPDFTQPDDAALLKVAVLGRENAGKSYLMNNLLGHHLCPVSSRAFTTRRYTMGVTTQKEKQLVLLDTPPLCPALPQLRRGAFRPDALKVNEISRRITTTEAAWEAMHSADAVVLVLSGATGTVHEEDELLLDQFHARLDAMERTPRVFIAVTKSDLQPSPLDDSFVRNVKALVHFKLEDIFIVNRNSRRNYAGMRAKLLAHCVPDATHMFPATQFTNLTPFELVEDHVVEWCMRRMPTTKGISAKYVKAKVVGWLEREDDGESFLHIDVVVTVAHPIMMVLIKNLTEITNNLHKNLPQYVGGRKVKLHYHIQKAELSSWGIDNPYGLFKPGWASDYKDSPEGAIHMLYV